MHELDEAPPCPRHPGRTLTLVCATCRARICVECGGERERRRLCEDCVARSYAADVAAAEVERVRPAPTGARIPLIAIGVLALAAGVVYLVARPSIERAKEGVAWKECEIGLRKVHEAARLYSEDHGKRLPATPDLRSDSVVDALIADGYLTRRPRHLAPGSVWRDGLLLDGDPLSPYLLDDAPHGDGKRHFLRVDGAVLSLTETEEAAELARAATATAQPLAVTASATVVIPPSAGSPSAGAKKP